MLDLLYQYKQAIKDVKKRREELKVINNKTVKDEEDIKLYSNMISSLDYVARYIEEGREPGAKRGIERREVYKRLIYCDPKVLDIFPSQEQEADNNEDVTHIERIIIEEALNTLTEREKDIYILNKAHLYSYDEIGSLLGISKSTVQTHMKRANKKLNKFK